MTFRQHESKVDAALDKVPVLGRLNRLCNGHKFGLYVTLLVLCVIATVLITIEGL